jgi:hypothetical protein
MTFYTILILSSTTAFANTFSIKPSSGNRLQCESNLILETSEIQLPEKYEKFPIEQRIKLASTWLTTHLIEILSTQPIQKNYHVVEYMKFRNDLLAGQFLIEEPKIVSSSPHSLLLESEFFIPNIYNPNVRYSAIFQLAFMLSTSGKSLIILSSYKEVRGINNGIEDWVDRLEIAKKYKSELLNAFIQNSHTLNVTRSYPWVEYQRDVLESEIIPLALRDPSVLEVGIGFSRNQPPNSRGWEISLPNLIIGRDYEFPTHPEAQALKELLPSRPDRPVSFAGVDVYLEYLNEQQMRSVDIPDRKNYLIVFNEMRDSNPSGVVYVIHRKTGERISLHFHPKTQDYKFFRPQGDQLIEPINSDQMYNSRKTSSGMINRFSNLALNGFNPKVKVTVFWKNSYADEHILFVSDIQNLTLRSDVERVVEYIERFGSQNF